MTDKQMKILEQVSRIAADNAARTVCAGINEPLSDSSIAFIRDTVAAAVSTGIHSVAEIGGCS